MNHRSAIDAWINYIVSDWLDKRSDTHLHPSVQPLINKLRNYVLDPNHFGEAWHTIKQIEQLYEHIRRENNKTSARMFLECGVAAYKMGDAHEAISFLTRTLSSFTENHDKGVTCWLLGCVYWYINNPINALAYWEDGYRYFKEQSMVGGRGSSLETWYSEKIVEMEAAILFAAENESPSTPTVRPAAKGRSTLQHMLQALPVIGQIPAGMPLNILPDFADFLYVNKVSISDKDYYAVSLLRGEKIIKIIQRQQFYYVLKVSGNSMNNCSSEPINDGDYVILREQYVANSGDIVAAVIVNDDDSLATLKRYVVRDEKIYLEPESTDPRFKKPVYNRSFLKPNDEFQIRGVAIAVLKPL